MRIWRLGLRKDSSGPPCQPSKTKSTASTLGKGGDGKVSSSFLSPSKGVSWRSPMWCGAHSLSGEGKHSFFRSWQNKNSHPSSFWFPFQEFLTSPFIPSEIFLTCPARAEVGLELFWKFIRLVPWAIPKGPYTPAPAKGPKTSSFFHKFLHI